jgi:pimeloyl-ACP methyl ester carboxylesterase
MSAHGPATDMMIFGRHWPLSLDAARMRARLWLGDQDRSVPKAAAERLARRLPACELVALPGEGHLWVALNYAEVLRWIAGTIGDRSSAAPPQAGARPPR